jgi:hypothetical protein
MINLARLQVRLYANDTLVAETEDTWLWSSTLGKILDERDDKSLTGSTPDKGAIEGLVPSAVPEDRAVDVTEPAQGGGAGNPSALGRASTNEDAP